MSKQQESGGDDDENDPLCVIHFIYWEEFDEYIDAPASVCSAQLSRLSRSQHLPGYARVACGSATADALDIHPQNNNWITASIDEISEDESASASLVQLPHEV